MGLGMTAWGEDPELLATFRAEVEERLASLQAGLLALEHHARPRQAVAGLFRDAHTVKGSARMLGLHGVLRVAHSMEDLFGALRDGRFPVRRDHIDLLLTACDCIGRALPGGELDDEALAPLVAALAARADGREPAAGSVVPVAAVPTQAVPASAVPVAVAAEPAPLTATIPTTRSAAAAAAPAAAAPDAARGGADSVRVAAGKVYDLIDVVGEADLSARRVERTTARLVALAAEQARWATTLRNAVGPSGGHCAGDADVDLASHRLAAAGEELTATVRSLRELVELHRGGMALVRDSAMGLAMVPVRRVFAALPRIARDVAAATGKDVELELSGEDVEIDKQVLDGVADALKHLVINAVDHGCERAAAREASGKPARSVVRVNARSAGGTVVLEVADDGAGVDEDAVRQAGVRAGVLPADTTLSGPPLLDVLFTPALSTAGSVTETSGRGVGLDVVAEAVQELGGSVEVRSERGSGTSFSLTLPLTLGVLRCLVARVGNERYAIPVAGVVESLSLRSGSAAVTVHTLAGADVVVRHGVSVPLLDLGAALGTERAGSDGPRAALLVRHAGAQLAWAVDRLEGESELVVKDLGSFLGRVPGIAGTTIDGDGDVVCLLDLRELAERALSAPRAAVPAPREAAAPAARPARVLVVEDSVGVRELERVILEGAGYTVETAVDGLDGASRLRAEPADLVLSDVEMPGMDGFALTRTIRRTKGWENVPVVIMTSRGDDTARTAGLEAGCSAYLLKHEFDQDSLVSTVRRLVGR
jgi:chemotaxis protein histidine kinase CheA/ActR/RegA family two-component response regulator